MTFRALLSGLLTRWEAVVDRALRDDAAEGAGGDRSRGEFISTLIIDRGAVGRAYSDRPNHGPSID